MSSAGKTSKNTSIKAPVNVPGFPQKYKPKAKKDNFRDLVGDDRAVRILQAVSKAKISGLPSVAVSGRCFLPQVPAVYFFYCDDVVLYVGQTKDLQERWSGHEVLKGGSWDGFEGARIAWIECPNDLLILVEGVLIKALNPPLNRAGKERG